MSYFSYVMNVCSYVMLNIGFILPCHMNARKNICLYEGNHNAC